MARISSLRAIALGSVMRFQKLTLARKFDVVQRTTVESRREIPIVWRHLPGFSLADCVQSASDLVGEGTGDAYEGASYVLGPCIMLCTTSGSAEALRRVIGLIARFVGHRVIGREVILVG
jgi:hypothetical protein